MKIYNGLFLSVNLVYNRWTKFFLKNDFGVRWNLEWILKNTILQIALTLLYWIFYFFLFLSSYDFTYQMNLGRYNFMIINYYKWILRLLD